MKRISLFLLATIFSAPTVCVAQSAPSVIGKMSWNFIAPLYLGATTVLTQVCEPIPPTCENIFPIGQICQTTPQICYYQPTGINEVLLQSMTASVTDPQNGLAHYALTGVANTSGGQSFPITGAMTMNGSSYQMSISMNQYSLSCTLAKTTLNGACINNASPSTPSPMNFQ